jgi:hypothetical protein
MEGYIDITGCDRRTLIREAYALSRPQGMGFLHFTPGPLPEDQVEFLVTSRGFDGLSLDYVNGRAVKLWVKSEADRDYLPVRWYDHTPDQLRDLLSRIGMPEKAAEVVG